MLGYANDMYLQQFYRCTYSSFIGYFVLMSVSKSLYHFKMLSCELLLYLSQCNTIHDIILTLLTLIILFLFPLLRTKCIGITIETRPDYCLKPHLSEMLSYGCTRIEIGVQSIYEDVARDTNRGEQMVLVVIVIVVVVILAVVIAVDDNVFLEQ